MTLTFDANGAAISQSEDWDCSAAALAWVLESVGMQTSQDDIVSRLGPANINPQLGLLDASGAALAAVANGFPGVQGQHDSLQFDGALDLAGRVPLCIGGVAWDHWSGVRGKDGDTLLLANPAPGYDGVGQSMTRAQWTALGPFYGVWVENAATASTPAAPVTAPVSPGSFPTWGKWALGLGIGAVVLDALDVL